MPRPKKIKTSLGQRLTSFREQAGYKHRPDFAAIFGISSTTIGNYERGDREPHLQFLLLYSEHFNANLHWLITGEGEMFSGGAESLPPHDKKAGKTALRSAVKAVETGLAGAKLTPDKKAELIDLSTALLQEGKAEYLRKIITMLVKIDPAE